MKEPCTGAFGVERLIDLREAFGRERWLATFKYVLPGDNPDFPRFVCRRHHDPVRLMWWITAVKLNALRQVPGGAA